MAPPIFSLLIFFLSLPTLMVASEKTYIVAMNNLDKPESFATHLDWYVASLQSLSSASASLLYSYTNAFHGFAAVLDEAQVEALQESEFVLGVYEDPIYTLSTTRSPHFLGLDSIVGVPGESPSNSRELDNASADIIIGVLDSGIWPESKSFDDTGMPPIPKKWCGKCESGRDGGFSPKLCNKKLIGAMAFWKGINEVVGGGFSDTITPRALQNK